MHEIQKAVPGARRWAGLLVFCGILVALIVIWLVKPFGSALEAWVTRDPEEIGSRLRLAFAAVALAVAAPVLGLAGYFWRVGARIIGAEQFPAPGTLVMRDTLVLRGAPARRRGRLMQLVAVFLVAAAFGLTVVLWQLVSLLDSRVS